MRRCAHTLALRHRQVGRLKAHAKYTLGATTDGQSHPSQDRNKSRMPPRKPVDSDRKMHAQPYGCIGDQTVWQSGSQAVRERQTRIPTVRQAVRQADRQAHRLAVRHARLHARTCSRVCERAHTRTHAYTSSHSRARARSRTDWRAFANKHRCTGACTYIYIYVSSDRDRHRQAHRHRHQKRQTSTHAIRYSHTEQERLSHAQSANDRNNHRETAYRHTTAPD